MAWQTLTKWKDSIVFRSLLTVALVSVLLGALSIAVVRDQAVERVNREALQRLGELLDTVENTASVACFTNDEQLAREVVQGLLRNSDVQRVTLSSGKTVLAKGERSTPQGSEHPPVLRDLASPFDFGLHIGEIRIDADWEAIHSRMESDAQSAVLALTGQLLLVIFGTGVMVFFVVVRPIKFTSDSLHRLDPAGGGRLAVPEGHEHTEIGRLVGDINDLSGRLIETLDQERGLRQQQEVAQRKYQDLFDHASSGIFVADRDGQLSSFNPAYLRLTWLPRTTAAAGRALTEPGWIEADRLLALLRASADQREMRADDFLLRGQRGDERWLHVALVPLGDGSVQGTVTDVTARKREELSARRLAVTDLLTGFANRAGLLQEFSGLDAASTPPFAVAMVNLDGFKQVNDTRGFAVGDRVLLIAAERIRATAQPGDTLARIGGDEFLLAIGNSAERSGVEERVAALHASLSAPYALDDGPLALGARLGIARFPQDGTDMPQLLRSAELAINSMREPDRAAGAPGYRFFDPQFQVAIEHRRRLEDDLRIAVGNSGLHLAFQPIIDLNANRLAGAEALLRWQHAERGFISPETFIPLAERVGLIGEIGQQVLEEACRQVAGWRRNGLDMYVSVNVSASQIPDELPLAAILSALARHGLPARAIAIEITEGVLMTNIGIAQRWIGDLRSAGLRVYLDDFGTGYSSLSYLKRFPLDTVKVDKSFVMDMNADNSDRALVDAIITMAGSLGLDVVAEGIEEASQLALLREMRCGFGQGYFFSRPVSAVDFAATARRIQAELASARRPDR